MSSRLLAATAFLIVWLAPAALAQPLTRDEVIKHVVGVWGWPLAGDWMDEFSCETNPQRVWLEDGGKTFKSKDPRYPVFIGKVLAPSANEKQADAILMSYINKEQIGRTGKQVIWRLSMPDRNTIVWQDTTETKSLRPAIRCPEKGTS